VKLPELADPWIKKVALEIGCFGLFDEHLDRLSVVWLNRFDLALELG
jgi:hypothetical protein